MESIINQEIAWVLAQQLSSGAVITDYPAQPKIIPYFANLALYGVASYGQHLEKVRHYLNWYITHLENPDRFGVNGTVYDYLINDDEKEIPTMNYDSSDSYGATFLTLVRLYYTSSGDSEWIKNHRQELDLIAGAVLSTLEKDSLTLAKPDWKVKYLMDNCEVYKGLKDYAWLLEEVFKDQEWAKRFETLAQKVKEAIEKKMRVNGGYSPAIYLAGFRKRPNWRKWYPDAMAQLFPILTGVLDPGSETARQLYGNFLRNYPDWYNHTLPQNFKSPLVVYTAALMEDRWRVRQYIESLKENILSKGHPWPYHSAEAGILILALHHYSKGKVTDI
ncbi:MAG: hypothetical protein PWP31_797 [Clostridia bacterium]|nr:hypothetical protein [Clostridia bacterium]